MKCPSCGMANSQGQKICNHCGTSLNKKFKTCKNGHNYDSSMSDCPYCPGPEVSKELKTSTSTKKTVIDRQEKIITKPKIVIPKSILKTPSPQPVSSKKIVVEKPVKKKIPVEKEIITEREIVVEKKIPVEKEIVTEKEIAVEKKIPVEKEIVTEKEIAVEKKIPVEKEIAIEKEVVVKDSSLIRLVGWLVSYDIDPAGIDFKLYKGRIKIGRSKQCQIIVNDSTISEEHVLLLYKDKKFILQDELSANGTFVNGKQIEERVLLEDGDEIKLGSVTFIIKII
jgi:hypothetical protein